MGHIQTNIHSDDPESFSLIDIGANLTNRSFKADLDNVIAEAKKASVSHIIVTGTSPQQSVNAAKLCEQHKGFLFSTAGCHPHDAKNFKESDYALLKSLANKPQVIAIGECGLDFNRNFSPQDAQIKVFEKQLQLASELGLPVFLHQRDAHQTFFEILKQYRDKLSKVVVHCFTDGPEELSDYLDINCHIGVTGWVCDNKRGQQLQQAVPLIPEDKIMIETDAPYLLPKTLKTAPKKNRNEPKFLKQVCEEVARLRGITTKQVAELTTKNSQQFFGI